MFGNINNNSPSTHLTCKALHPQLIETICFCVTSNCTRACFRKKSDIMDHIYYTYLVHYVCTKKQLNLFLHSQNIETVPWKNNHCVLGQFCDGPVAEKFHTTILHVCAKFHAFITKGTIYFYICCTRSDPSRCEISQQTQNICITFVQCWTNVEDVGPTLYVDTMLP